MNIFNRLSDFFITQANLLIHFASPVSGLSIFIIIFLVVAAYMVGRRLGRFVKPDSPYLSPIIRWLGSVMSLAGLCILMLVFLYMVSLIFFVVMGYIISPALRAMAPFEVVLLAFGNLWKETHEVCMMAAEGAVSGLIFSLFFILRLIPEWERGDGFSDVTELVHEFKQLNGYDPRPFFKRSKGCFVGKDDEGNPIYIPWGKIRETHIQVMGATGSGKGVWLSAITYQCILAGEGLFWFDPKGDRFSPKLMHAAANRAGKPFFFINLNPDQPPQLNIFSDARAYEIAELFVAGFDLQSKGTDGDFHRGKDEDAAYYSAELIERMGDQSFSNLIAAFTDVESIIEQENFWRHFLKLGRLQVFNTNSGLSLVDAVEKGAVVYVVGSTTNPEVKMAQKMVLVRLLQIISKRDRSNKNPPEAVILDEFKHLLSPAALTALGAIRDFDSHFFLAHQSIGDLNSCPGIESAEAYGAVVDNTAIKVVYKISDADYAEKLSKVGGKVRTHVDSVAKTIHETGVAIGSWQEAQTPLISPDLITHLPMPSDRPKQASVGIIFGVGNAKKFHIGPIPVEGAFPRPIKADESAEPSGMAENSPKSLVATPSPKELI